MTAGITRKCSFYNLVPSINNTSALGTIGTPKAAVCPHRFVDLLHDLRDKRGAAVAPKDKHEASKVNHNLLRKDMHPSLCADVWGALSQT